MVMNRKRPTKTILALAGALLAVGCNAAGEPPDFERAPREVEADRGFNCIKDAVTAPMTVTPVENALGHTVEIVPSGAACQFNLAYRDGGGVRAALTGQDPGAYMVASAKQTPEGVRIVCASKVVHEPSRQASSHRRIEVRKTSTVPIECASFDGGAWSTLNRVVDPAGDWAAWVLGVIEAGPGRFRVYYTRDFSFQVMNMSDRGRPAEDGIYETELILGPSGPTAGATRKISDTTLLDNFVNASQSDTPIQDLQPTGECPPPNGCEQPVPR